MGNSKIVYYGETLIDLTGDTVEPAKLLKGVTAHDKSGTLITGTFEAADPYAIISVTYPEGSVCTCSNGSVSLPAKDTSGKAMFIIPAAGTWTVTATKGSQSKSAAVEITAEGQVEMVALSFALLLFNNGLVDGIAWDYVYNQNSFASSTISDVINMRSQTFDVAGVRTSPRAYRGISTAIDLSDYSVLKIRVKACASSAGQAYFQIGTGLSGSNLGQVAITKEAGQTTSIDVSALNQSGFIMMQVFGGNDYGATIDISFDKVWAE